MLKKVSFRILSVFAILVAFYGFAYMFMPAEAGSPEIRERFAHWWLAGYGHVFGGGMALLLGPIQFSPWLRRKHMNWHRWIGRIYAVSVIVGGLSGLFVAHYASGGLSAQTGFAMLAILWLISIAYAWIRIRQGNKGEHRKWMIRNFALTLAAVSLRIQLPLLTGAMGLSFEPSYQFIAWMCWIPNLVIAEWWILNKR